MQNKNYLRDKNSKVNEKIVKLIIYVYWIEEKVSLYSPGRWL